MRRSVPPLAPFLVAVVLNGSGGAIAAGSSASAPSTTWEPLGLTSANVRAIAVDPDRPSNVYAGGESSPDNTDFFRSPDGGLTWLRSHVDAPMTSMFWLAVEQSRRPHVLWAVGSDGAFTSVDDGESWTRHPAGGGTVLALDPARPGTMYFAGGVNIAARSTDGAATAQPLRAATVPLCDYGAVVVAPSVPSTVYLGGGCGVFRSTDRGATWRALPGAPIGVESLAVSPGDADLVYAGTEAGVDGAGLWETGDGGADWRRLDAGGSANVVLLDPSDPSTLYVADAADGVLRWSSDSGATWVDLGGPIPAIQHDFHALAVANGYLLAGGRGGIWRLALPAPHDGRYFPRTGYHVDNDIIWDYFTHRGGAETFGEPISRTFLLQGFVVQLFQRRAIQLHGRGQPRLLNLLDPDLLPYASFDGASIPRPDASLMAATPDPTDWRATLDWVRSHVPDRMGDRPVNFYQTFLQSIVAGVAWPGSGAGPAPILALELWGVPTSPPTVDPARPEVVTLRWQRGAMRYDGACRCTRSILSADQLRSILTGQDLPADLALEARGSPFLDQYDPSAPHWVRNASSLPNTDLTDAFEPE